MDLGKQRPSGNVEDRRGIGLGGGLGVGGIVVALVAYFLGFDPGTAIDVAQQVTSGQQETRQAPRGAPQEPPEDVAAVAARLLLSDAHVGRSYELTGPSSLSRREKVALIGQAFLAADEINGGVVVARQLEHGGTL